ncbi:MULTISPECIES: TetR/AcrR family transcriptional regulator [Pectobacterium]|uniref:TetR family transcriptional regulator n=1 Tax=Pectobacterium odoriferum TaxID=78398 RepID=A0ABD6VKA4_9GAMM|nr:MULTISPECIES: TetR/AcrR family transcriptional regulator [Pectobacterium]AIU89033.1 TetR family transcriptional regulator [Pectobacterium odoriferum]KGA36859.1 TetR family transcriptional regulator [Pectobacterium odoriferum]KGA41046.1 TetR family transcriptional regulator [Pectobacterium odoriferum]MBA0187160.1 TetR/AcrR family transcriptional regulator [Pectobacterium odoriferum]MCA6962967.1 TetR/AcrR family transcriptional regulator [Pectobacterium odoriferum]
MTVSTHNKSSRRGRPRNFDRDKALVSALGVFWRCGYEPASVGELCRVMDINPPSLYAAFGSKAELFLEAVNYYERTFWDAPWERMLREENVYDAVHNFFEESAVILTSQEVPCGCLVVLAAINVSPDSKDVYNAVKALREEGRVYFRQRLQAGKEDGQLPPETDIEGIAMTLNTLLEGMSIPAQDGIAQDELKRIADQAVRLLPRP